MEVYRSGQRLPDQRGRRETPRESEELFRCIVENAPYVTVILEDDLGIRYANPAVEEVLGYRPEEIVGTNVSRYLHPEESEWMQNGFVGENAELGNVSKPMELRMRRSDGSWCPLETVGIDLLDDPNIKGIVVYLSDATEHKALREALTHRAFHDLLTSLPNRALFMDRLEHALAHASRHRQPVTVLFFDVDDLKAVNDGFGHEVGDELLVSVGSRLRACVRPGDTVARLGGDEFAVLLEDATGSAEATRVVERIVETWQAPVVVSGHTLFVTASVGIATSDFGQDRAEELLRRADLAMYRAKEKGKARYELFLPSTVSKVLERIELENDLRGIVERGELKVYYQPEVVPGTGAIVGMEALLRWDHPRRGLIPPAEFVPLAEMSGLIVPIGRWVLEEACRQALLWQEQYPDAPPLVSVNLSAKQFQRPALIEEITETLQKIGLDPHNLALEVAESLPMENAPHLTNTAQELKKLGIKLVVDDFGTGNSSLSYLEHFPADILKIDRSFIDKLGRDEGNTATLVAAMICFTQTLNTQAVAEGVETAEQLDELLGMGCDLAQGFYFWEPLTSDAATELLRTHQG